MGEKNLNTILKIRYDTYDNWMSVDPILRQGEIAIVLVESENNDVQPVVLSKTGNGTNKFSLLPWNSANAADVYDWAKQANKPTYTKEEIGLVIDEAMSDTSSNPVQNKVISSSLNKLEQDISKNVSDITNLQNQLSTIEENTTQAMNTAISAAQSASEHSRNALQSATDASASATAAQNSAQQAAISAEIAANPYKMRFIRQITTTEKTTSIVINADENGNSISLDKFCLVLALPSAISITSGGMNILCNGTSSSHYAYYHAGTATVKHARFEGECMGDTTGAEGAKRHWMTTYALGASGSYGNVLKTERYLGVVPTITKMTFKMASIPVGTVLTLYGRTAQNNTN